MHHFSPSQRPVRHVAVLLALLFMLGATLAVPAQAAPPGPAEVSSKITWNGVVQTATNVARANYPWVAVDSNDKTHIVFISQLPDLSWELRYINNVSGAFNSPGQLIENIEGTTAVPSAVLIAGAPNVLHMLYTQDTPSDSDDKLYYRQSTNNGASWAPRQLISNGGKSAAPNMAVDAAGNAYIVWISDNCGDKYNVQYRFRAANGALSGVSKPKDECGTFQNRPQITVAGGKPHVAFQRDESVNAEIYYARLEGSQWVNQSISQSPGITSQNPALASDGGNNLFVAWDENTNSNTNHEIFFKASFNGGQTWSDANNLTNNAGLSTNPFIAWSSTAQRAIIAWDDTLTNGGDRQVWTREFDPASRDTSAAFQVSKTPGLSLWPSVGAGPNRVDIAWHDRATGTYQIYDLAGVISGSPPPCGGTISLGSSPTKSNPVAATITPDADCAPTQMQISVDAPIESETTPAPVAYTANPSISMPSSGCSHVVYVRLFEDGAAGEPFASDPIVVDQSVDADVLIANPHMQGLPVIYNNLMPADAFEDGAQGGDSRYTRDLFFFLGINKGAECSELANFNVPAIASGSIPAAGYAKSLALPGSTFPGPRPVSVTITDTLGNQRDYTSNIVYDPADTDPSPSVSNTLGLPVLDMSQEPTVAGPSGSTDYIVVRFLFNKIHVQDNLYGDGSGPGTADFWGVWVANSPTNVGADSPTLQWYPVKVEQPGPIFVIDWNLFTGLTKDEQRAGPYFVYVRLLDGAGNPSKEVLETQVTLAAGYSVSRSYLARVAR